MLKSNVCTVLGYPVPEVFRKIQPRFPGQNFDTYVQKSNNLQIWNEEISGPRRYVLIRVNEKDVVTKVRVVTGDVIAAYDTTGTLTRKYQAKAKTPPTGSQLVSATDTASVTGRLITAVPPAWPRFLVIARLYRELLKLIGTTIINPGITQERNRGGSLHEAVCKILWGFDLAGQRAIPGRQGAPA